MTIVNLNDKKILIYEHNRQNLLLLRTLLFGLGATGEHITDAHTTNLITGHLQRLKFDLIILNDDCILKNKGALPSRLRRNENSPNRKTPVLILTHNPNRELIYYGFQGGINGVVIKPISPQNLRIKIESVLMQPRPFVISNNYHGPARGLKMLFTLAAIKKKLDDINSETTGDSATSTDIEAKLRQALTS